MVAQRRYVSRFTNSYGETWEFQYDPVSRGGVLRGTDVDWQEFRVVDGAVPELILNDEEIRWLRAAWEEATTGSS